MPFFTNGDDNTSQGLWARENGMPNKPSLEDILLAQIEHHRTELRPENILLAGSAIRKCEFDSRRRGAWKFSSILAPGAAAVARAELFFPAIDPVMGECGHGERPIDVLFVGGDSRHHFARAKIIEQVASLAYARQVVYCLGASRLTGFAESLLGHFLPLRRRRRPGPIAKIASLRFSDVRSMS